MGNYIVRVTIEVLDEYGNPVNRKGYASAVGVSTNQEFTKHDTIGEAINSLNRLFTVIDVITELKRST